jgi:hypothetical protein
VAVSHILVEGALYLLPALLLAAALLARRPGERLIVALHRRCAQRARKAGSVAAPGLRLAHPTEHSFPRGGRLIAAALAGRAPPPARAAAHRS